MNLSRLRPQLGPSVRLPVLTPEATRWPTWAVATGGLLAVYLGFATWVPAADDEVYYWCWAQSLQPSYFDHPGMSAYLIRASTTLFGDSMMAVRLPACLTALVVLGVIARLSRPRVFVPWLLLTPLFSLGAVIVTPDTPLLLFWAGYLLWLVIAHERLTPGDGSPGRIPVWLWLVGGVVLGCGALGKYTMGLAVPAGFVSFVLARGVSWRTWLPGYIGHGVVSAVVASPILIFNLRHDFAPLRFQWEHANQAAAAGRGWLAFLEFVGVQVLLFGTLPVILLPWAWANMRTLAADPRLRVCAALFAVPMSVFLYKATRGPLEANWALVAFVGFWPVAAAWYATRRSRWTRWAGRSSMLIPATCTAILIVHLISPLAVIPPARDRITRQAERLKVAEAAADAIRAHGEPLPVYATSYQWTAMLRYEGADARQIAGATRPSNFTLTPERLGDVDRAYVFSEGPLVPDLAPGFGPPEIVANFPLVVRGTLITCYQVLVYTKSL